MVHRKKNSLAESRGSSSFLNFKKKKILISGTFKFSLFTGAIFERIFPPRGKPWDLDESCFPYTFGPTFMPPIHFWRRTQKKLNHFYPTVVDKGPFADTGVLFSTMQLDSHA